MHKVVGQGYTEKADKEEWGEEKKEGARGDGYLLETKRQSGVAFPRRQVKTFVSATTHRICVIVLQRNRYLNSGKKKRTGI